MQHNLWGQATSQYGIQFYSVTPKYVASHCLATMPPVTGKPCRPSLGNLSFIAGIPARFIVRATSGASVQDSTHRSHLKSKTLGHTTAKYLERPPILLASLSLLSSLGSAFSKLDLIAGPHGCSCLLSDKHRASRTSSATEVPLGGRHLIKRDRVRPSPRIGWRAIGIQLCASRLPCWCIIAGESTGGSSPTS